jgi:dual oxidase maturation factor 1
LKHGNETSSLEHEIIDYNEHFSWEWAQGRFGFGKYAGQFSKDFRAASERGVPLPILQIAEYFTFDGEGIRFGRYYRLAGWYSHLLMW